MRFGWSSKASFQRVLWLAMAFCLVYVAGYFAIYWFQPFSDFWNNLLSNVFTQVASLIGTVLAIMIWSMYEKTDAPRSIWGYFAVGLGLWFAGEVSWGYLNMTMGEVPIGLADVFWILAYFFFGHALIRQYRIVRQPTANELLVRILVGIVAALLLTFAIYWLVIEHTDTQALLNAVVNSFYPAADLIMAVIALRLARNFSGGAFSRPWLGLLVFTFSDFLYAWSEASGMYAWSVEQGNLLTTVVDLTYLIAYLVLALGVLYQWLFLKYGLRSGSRVR
jgi:hypothetical protein